MKKNNLYIVFFLGVLLFPFISCEKNELDATYTGISRIVIVGDEDEGARADSLLFSFSAYESIVEDFDVHLIAQIMGNLSNESRTFRLEVDPEQTTAQPEEYEFPETVTIAPQAYQVSVPVTIRRTERIQESNIKLVLRVAPTADFEPGPYVSGTTVNAGPSFAIVWNDQFSKPVQWDQAFGGYRFTLGNWSRVKHQLIIDLTGIRDLTALTSQQRYIIQAAGTEYLTAYRATNPMPGPDYISELTGLPINFCNACN